MGLSRCRLFFVLLLVMLVADCASSSMAASEFPEPGRVLDGRAILHLSAGNNMCAMTFDDGPGPHTARLLDILKERGVHATFFVVGNQLELRPGLIRRMLEEGHEVGNHSLAHGNLQHMPEKRQREEIGTVQKLLHGLCGEARLFRPPYGRFDETGLAIAREEGMAIVLWSVDSMDWMHGASIETMQTQISGQKLRGIFLFHDTHVRTVDAMPEILDRLAADGCQFVTVSEFVREAERLKNEEAAAETGRNEDTTETGEAVEEIAEEPAGEQCVSGEASGRTPSVVPAPGDTLREYRHPLERTGDGVAPSLSENGTLPAQAGSSMP